MQYPYWCQTFPDFSNLAHAIIVFSITHWIRIYFSDEPQSYFFHFLLGQLQTLLFMFSTLLYHFPVQLLKIAVSSAAMLLDNVFSASNSKDVATMQFCANKLDKKDFFGKSDPFMVFFRSNEDGTWVEVFLLLPGNRFAPILTGSSLAHSEIFYWYFAGHSGILFVISNTSQIQQVSLKSISVAGCCFLLRLSLVNKLLKASYKELVQANVYHGLSRLL